MLGSLTGGISSPTLIVYTLSIVTHGAWTMLKGNPLKIETYAVDLMLRQYGYTYVA